MTQDPTGGKPGAEPNSPGQQQPYPGYEQGSPQQAYPGYDYSAGAAQPGWDHAGYGQTQPYPPQAYQQPGYGDTPYPTHGYPQGYGQQGYPGYPQTYGQQAYPYPVARPTNTMAILSIIFAFVLAPLGIVFGIMAKNQIKQSGEEGQGLATAGIIVGSVFTALFVLLIIFYIIFIAALASTVSQIPGTL